MADPAQVVAAEANDPATQLLVEMTRLILADFEGTGGVPSEVAVLVSGLGATPVNELYVLFDQAPSELEARGARVGKAWVGNYFTSLEMVGATLTVMALDDERRALIAADVACPGFPA